MGLLLQQVLWLPVMSQKNAWLAECPLELSERMLSGNKGYWAISLSPLNIHPKPAAWGSQVRSMGKRWMQAESSKLKGKMTLTKLGQAEDRRRRTSGAGEEKMQDVHGRGIKRRGTIFWGKLIADSSWFACGFVYELLINHFFQ
jgi:hypothetical protein